MSNKKDESIPLENITGREKPFLPSLFVKNSEVDIFYDPDSGKPLVYINGELYGTEEEFFENIENGEIEYYGN